jgi:hypothetical protein
MLTRNHRKKKKRVENEVEVRWFGRATNTLMASPHFVRKMLYIK